MHFSLQLPTRQTRVGENVSVNSVPEVKVHFPLNTYGAISHLETILFSSSL
jgi:hypothetical protein